MASSAPLPPVTDQPPPTPNAGNPLYFLRENLALLGECRSHYHPTTPHTAVFSTCSTTGREPLRAPSGTLATRTNVLPRLPFPGTYSQPAAAMSGWNLGCPLTPLVTFRHFTPIRSATSTAFTVSPRPSLTKTSISASRTPLGS